MPANTCAGTNRNGEPCARPPGWGLSPDDPDAAEYCKVHTPGKRREDELLKKRFLEKIRSENVTLSRACRDLGTSTAVLFRIRSLDPAFDEEVRKAYEANNEARVVAVESAMYERLLDPDGNAPAALYVFYLCNRSKDWQSVQHIRVGGSDGGPLEFELSNARELLEDRINRVARRVGASLPPQVPNGSGGS